MAARETSLFQHNGGTNSGPPETSRTSQHYRMEGFAKRIKPLRQSIRFFRHIETVYKT